MTFTQLFTSIRCGPPSHSKSHLILYASLLLLSAAQGATPLHLAVRNAHSGEAWRVTITAVAAHPLTYLNAVDSAGWTPLMHAARQGDTQTVQLLLQAGASARVLDAHGQPAATLAIDADVRSALAEAAVAEIEKTHAAWLLQQDQHSTSLDTVADSSSSSGSSSSNSQVCASADSGSE
jgi:ankyrin repeat protein